MSFVKAFHLPDCTDPFNFNQGYQTYYKKDDLPVQVGQWVSFGVLIKDKPFYFGQLFLRFGYWCILPIGVGESIIHFSKRYSAFLQSGREFSFSGCANEPGLSAYNWSRDLKKLAKRDPIHAMQILRNTAHEHGFTFHTPTKPVNKPTYPVRSPFQRNNVVSFSRPVKNRFAPLQTPSYALASRRAFR